MHSQNANSTEPGFPVRTSKQDVPLADNGEGQETQWSNPDLVLERCRTEQGTCESERRERIPEGPKPPHSRLAGSSMFRLRLLVLAPPPTRLLVQPTPHPGGDTPPPPQSEERRLARMFAAARPRGSIWPAGPETALQGHRSVL